MRGFECRLVDQTKVLETIEVSIRWFVDIESGELVVSPPTLPRGAGGLVLKSQRLGLRLGRWSEPSTKKTPPLVGAGSVCVLLVCVLLFRLDNDTPAD